MRYVRILSWKKLFNLIKIELSYLLSIILKKNVLFASPYSLTIEPTNHCNLKCPECPSGSNKLTREKGRIDKNLFKKAIDETSNYAFYLLLYFQGEPYLHPEFTDMVSYAKSKRFYVCTSTNGHFLTPENAFKTVQSELDKIIISMDGTTQEVYKNYRKGGQLGTVLEGIKNLSNAKTELKSKYPEIEVQFLVFKFNEYQMADAKKLAKKLGVNQIKFKSVQFYDPKNSKDLLPTKSKYSRYKTNDDNSISIKKKLKNRCKRLWTTTVITYDGNVVPCCYDKDGTYCMGNIINSDFNEIWKNEAYDKFRQQILTNRKSMDICRNCW